MNTKRSVHASLPDNKLKMTIRDKPKINRKKIEPLYEDHKLSSAVEYYNQQVQLLNDIKTPRLSLDILQAHKKATDPKTKYRKNYNLYHDGIHPIRPLAKLWMYKILGLAKELNE